GPTGARSAVTGRAGRGREPQPAPHRPDRHGNVRAYNPLRHRHADEMSALLGRMAGAEIDVRFVPHSGNFARGILSTIFLDAQTSASEEELIQMVNEMYASRGGFVTASAAMPSVKDVIGTNQVRVGVVREGDQIVLTSALDNLTKGASGGAMQWMNRLAGLDDATGLKSPGWGWN
ncbi:MAG TPA: N-acetyl-gamma-glutamyl-phosphate reductase, partial [Armatimonadetes bacterium]|nr:N-acetyl-gamma-glutamyl-phosphate reductase [Armatimonadota bacterium]